MSQKMISTGPRILRLAAAVCDAIDACAVEGSGHESDCQWRGRGRPDEYCGQHSRLDAQRQHQCLPYNLTGLLSPVEPAPAAHEFQYFAGPSGGSATITQDIDVSAAASNISGGNVKFNEPAYLGRTTGVVGPATFAVAFKNAAGQTFRTVTLGPASGPVGLYLEQQIGLVPSGTGSPRP